MKTAIKICHMPTFYFQPWKSMFYKRCINRRNRDPASIHRFQIKKAVLYWMRRNDYRIRGVRNSTGLNRYFPMPRVCLVVCWSHCIWSGRLLGKPLWLSQRTVYTGQTPFYPCRLREQELPVGMPVCRHV